MYDPNIISPDPNARPMDGASNIVHPVFEQPVGAPSPFELETGFGVGAGDLPRAGSLIELASQEEPTSDDVEFENLLIRAKRVFGTVGRYMARDAKRSEALYRQREMQSAAQRLDEQRGVWGTYAPWEAQQAVGGVGGGIVGMGATLMRLFDSDVADEMNRGLQAAEMAQTIGMKKDDVGKTRQKIARYIYGGAKSITQSIALGGAGQLFRAGKVGSTLLMGGGFSAVSWNESYTHAFDRLGSKTKARNYATNQAAWEGFFMTAFSAAGLGGLEKWFQGGRAGLAKQTWRQLGKELGVDFLAELGEEEMTTMMQTMGRVAAMPENKSHDAWIGDDGTFYTSPMWGDLKDTFWQTAATMGMTRLPVITFEQMFSSGRRTWKGAGDRVADVFDLDSKEGREGASDEELDAYRATSEKAGTLGDDLEWWGGVAQDEDRTKSEREVADIVRRRLEGDDKTVEGERKVLTNLIKEFQKTTKREIVTPLGPIADDPVNREARVSLPQSITKRDPDAHIVDPLDLVVVPGDKRQEEFVRGLSVVKELGQAARGGRNINFFQSKDPTIKGVYTGDAIFVAIPTVEKYTNERGVLDSEGMRKALTGTFAHEFLHELKNKNPEIWGELYDTLNKKGTKYEKLLREGESRFLKNFEKFSTQENDPYARLRGDDKAAALEALVKEEGLSFLMDSEFITTGLVSKMAKINRSGFERLGDWLRRMRNSLFGDDLYKGMVKVFNDVASQNPDAGVAPIATPPPRKRKAKQPKKRKAAGARKKKNRKTRKLPEWSRKAVDKLELRGSKVVSRDLVGPLSVVVTVKTKSGKLSVVTLRPDKKDPFGGPVSKTTKSATKDDLKEKVAESVFEAEIGDVALEAEVAAETISSRSDDPDAAWTDQINQDFDTYVKGLKDGFEDDETKIGKTDILELFKMLKKGKEKNVDEGGLFLTRAQGSKLDMKTLIDRGLVSQEKGGKYRLTGHGARILAWKTGDEHPFSVPPESAPPPSAAEDAAEPEGVRPDEDIDEGLGEFEDPDRFSTELDEGLLYEEASKRLASQRKASVDKLRGDLVKADRYYEPTWADERKQAVAAAREAHWERSKAIESEQELLGSPPRSVVERATEEMDEGLLYEDLSRNIANRRKASTDTLRKALVKADDDHAKGSKGHSQAVASAREAHRKRSVSIEKQQERLSSLPDKERFSVEIPDVEGLTDDDVRRMDDTVHYAEGALRNSPYAGRAYDLIEHIWEGRHDSELVVWMRTHDVSAMKRIIDGVWPKDEETGRLLEELNVGTQMISDLKIKLFLGEAPKTDGKERLQDEWSQWKLTQARAAVPSPAEYRQLRESSERLSTDGEAIDLPPEYFDDQSKHFVDEYTRREVDLVKAHGEVIVGKEVITHLETEIHGQTKFNKDPEGVTEELIEKGKSGEIFTARDWVSAREAHARLLNIVKAGNLTAAEIEELTAKRLRLAQYSGEAASEWGRSGAFMRDRVETVRERGMRAIDRALAHPSRKVQRRIARVRAKMHIHAEGSPKHVALQKKLGELREEWSLEAEKIHQELRGRGWNLDQLDRYLGSREAVEDLVHDIKKAKGDSGTYEQIAFEIFINNILSGPVTWTANVVSNLGMMAYEQGIKRHGAALLNEFALATGMPTGEEFGPRIGELKWLWKGAMQGFARGAENWWTSIKHEEDSFETSIMKNQAASRTRFVSHEKHIRGWGGRLNRLIGTTMLTALDSWQKTFSGHSEVMALAYRDAKGRQRRGEDGFDTDDAVGNYINSVIEDKSHPLWHSALERARWLAFQGEPGWGGRLALVARRQHASVKWVIPFVLTPDNIMRTGVAYSPLGLLSLTDKGMIKSIRRGMSGEGWDGINEKAAGWFVTVAMVMAMLNDDDEEPFFTGLNPQNPKGWASAERSQTLPPLSIWAGRGSDGKARYLSIARVEPFATWWGLTKEFCNGIKAVAKRGPSALLVPIEVMAESTANMFQDKTFMKTVSDAAKVVRDLGHDSNKSKGLLRIAESFILSTPPILGSNMLRQAIRAGKDYKTDTRVWGEGLERLKMFGRGLVMKAAPGMVYEEYDRYDQYGRKIPMKQTPYSSAITDIWYNIFVPAKAKHVHEGLADKQLRRYNMLHPDAPMGINKLLPFFENTDGSKRWLTPWEMSQYDKTTGEVFQKLADAEAMDVEEPTKQYIQRLWVDNWSSAAHAVRTMLKARWADPPLPVSRTVQSITDEVLRRNVEKDLNILSQKAPGRDPAHKRLSRVDQRRQKAAKTRIQEAEKVLSAKRLLMRGFTPEVIKAQPGIPSRGTMARRLKRLMEKHDELRQIKGQHRVPPRIERDRRTARR